MKWSWVDVNEYRKAKPAVFWTLSVLVVGALLSVVGTIDDTSRENLVTREERGNSCAPYPKDYEKLQGADLEVVDWALNKVHNHFDSDSAWCAFEHRAFLLLYQNKESVPFHFWTEYDVAAVDTYERAYEICRAFVEPFDTHGVSVKFMGNRLDGSVRIDGVEETSLRQNLPFMKGHSRAEDGGGTLYGCKATVWFPEVAAELESRGWNQPAHRYDKSFSLRPSQRADFFCTSSCAR